MASVTGGATVAGVTGAALCLAARERARYRGKQLRAAVARHESVLRECSSSLPDAKLYSARLHKLGEPFHASSSQTYLVPKEEQSDAWKRTNLDYGPKVDVLNRGKSKLVIVLVGKPGRAKTYVAHKLTRYLCWLRYAARVWTYSAIREELYGQYQAPAFFSSANAAGVAKRDAVCRRALQHCCAYLESGGEVGVLDGTNTSRARRDLIRATLNAGSPDSNVELLWVECICDDAELVAANLRQRVDAPEYAANARFSSEAERMADFAQRCAQYDGYECVFACSCSNWSRRWRLRARFSFPALIHRLCLILVTRSTDRCRMTRASTLHIMISGVASRLAASLGARATACCCSLRSTQSPSHLCGQRRCSIRLIFRCSLSYRPIHVSPNCL